MGNIIYNNFNDAYIGILKLLNEKVYFEKSVTDYLSVGSKFGESPRDYKELYNFTFSIKNPIDRFVYSKKRKINYPFAYANLVWVLAGSNKLSFLNFYNKRGKNFSDDGDTLNGAYGYRIFAYGNQIKSVVERLKKDLYSRRCVISLYDRNDCLNNSKDIPCALSLQFIFRKNKLDMICYSRSQSAMFVLPYDYLIWSYILEMISYELNVEVGIFTQFTNSMHIYQDEEKLLKEILAETNTISPLVDYQELKLPKINNFLNYFDKIYKLENELRVNLSGVSRLNDKFIDLLLDLFYLEHIFIKDGKIGIENITGNLTVSEKLFLNNKDLICKKN